MDECLTIPAADQGDDQRRWDTKPYATVCKHTQTANLQHNQSFLLFRNAHYEGGAVCSHARSLWRLEPLRIGSVLFLYSGALTGKKFFSFRADVRISLYTVGVVATWSGVSPSGCVTSQQEGICAWMKRKDSCLWTRKRRIRRTLLSAFVLLRSLYCSQLYNPVSGRLLFWKCFLTIFDVKTSYVIWLSRRRPRWLRNVMWREWGSQRSSMESPCAFCSMSPPACGSHMPQWMLSLLGWGHWRERYEF